MRIGVIPIRCLHRAGAIGKFQLDRQLPLGHERRFDPHGNQVERRMADGFDVDRLAIEFEMAHENAVPESQRLANFRQIFGRCRRAVGLREAKTELPEVQPVRIGPQPGHLGSPLVAGDIGVADLASMGVELA